MTTNQVLFFPITMLFTVSVIASDDVVSELSCCTTIDDDTVRLTCYDNLAQSEASQQVTGIAPISEDYGAEQLDSNDPNRKASQPVRAMITSCRKDVNNKYWFYLENGQVWKQKDDDRLRYKECNFGATLVRDGFGYKIQIDGAKRRTRVTRVR